MNDFHIHIGKFNDLYTTPAELKAFLDSVEVNYFAVSSTTICNGDYNKVISEFKELEMLCRGKMLPVLWIIPSMLTDGAVEMFLDSGICWKCIKIHPQLDPSVWTMNNGMEMQKVISIASTMQLPLLIHTGEYDGCYPSQYSKIIEQNPRVTFILAHGRPIDETMKLMKQHPNVWADTAFMPMEHVGMLCYDGLADRILWGTDYPIPRYFYPNKNMIDYYLGLLEQLKTLVSNEDFKRITQMNFNRLFSSH